MAGPLKPLGVFGPVSGGPWGPSADDLRPLVGRLDRDLRRKVASYLRGGAIVLAIMEYTEDVLDRRFGVSGGSAVLTDGAYYWRLDAADYVETYGIGLDDEIVRRMETMNWSVPDVSEAMILEYDRYLFKLLR